MAQEFYFAVLMAFLPTGEPAYFETLPTPTYEICDTAIKAGVAALEDELPDGSEIRASCVSTEKIGRDTI